MFGRNSREDEAGFVMLLVIQRSDFRSDEESQNQIISDLNLEMGIIRFFTTFHFVLNDSRMSFRGATLGVKKNLKIRLYLI